MRGNEETEQNKPLDRLREDGKWWLDSDKQMKEILWRIWCNILNSWDQQCNIHLYSWYYTGWTIKSSLVLTYITQHIINLHLPWYFPVLDFHLKMWQCTSSTCGGLHSVTHCFLPIVINWKARRGWGWGGGVGGRKQTPNKIIRNKYTIVVVDVTFFPSVPAESRLAMGKNMGREKAGTADSKWPKGYAIPYDVIFSTNKGLGEMRRRAICSYCIYLPK